MYEESKGGEVQQQFGIPYEMKSTGVSRVVNKISWSCRYCRTPLDEGKLFSHEATCSSKPKVTLKMPTRQIPQQKVKKGRQGMAIKP